MTKLILMSDPKVYPTGSHMHIQHNTYRNFILLGNTEITYDVSQYCDYMFSEREAWEIFNPYKDKFKIKYNPIALDDKFLSLDIFKQAGFQDLNTQILDSINLLQQYENKPIIIKPRIGAGGIGQNQFAYKIYNNPDDLACSITADNKDIFLNMIKKQDCIVQNAIAKRDQPYNQLFIEGFVNQNHQIFFTPSYEIEWVNARWTHQLKWDDSDNQQLEDVKQKIQKLVVDSNVKNTYFLLQLIRSKENKTWYPIDWQYRLTYNTLFSRAKYEPQYCTQLVNFMTNQIGQITEITNNKLYQAYIPINLSQNKQHVQQIMNQNCIVSIPVRKSLHEDTKNLKFLFVSIGETFDIAEQRMKNFEQQMA